MNPLIKWPGGKSGEIDKIQKFIPSYKRYVEPFFGGGAVFFHLNPKVAAINDISSLLMAYYDLVKKQDKQFCDLLLCYNNSFTNLYNVCNENYSEISDIYRQFADGKISIENAKQHISKFVSTLSEKINSGFSEKLLLDEKEFQVQLIKMSADKMKRTVANNAKNPLSAEDLKSNLLTGFTSGYYMYFRDIYNELNLGKIESQSLQYKIANFYFIREYCYGSMFRYNSKGEFNIPYGGISYNTKNFKAKIENMFTREVETIFKNTDISCCDFEEFICNAALTESDFMFLDPPYDTDFSDYEGKDFTPRDQERLADTLKKTLAKFILVIKNTDFIYGLYDNEHFNICSFDNQYTYNVRGRNEQKVEHLIITNLPV